MMKNFILFLLLLVSTTCFAQADKVQGVYLSKQGDTNMLALLADGYLSVTVYTDEEYKLTLGGPYAVIGNDLEIHVEYSDAFPEQVGTVQKYRLSFEGGSVKDDEGNLWVKQQPIRQGLDGLWRITGRMQGDKVSEIWRGDRKTIKLLVDGYFQWIAINPAEKGFYGTGGGTYTFTDGKYTENILFFSRDNARVGASLIFDGKIEDGQWHHSGKSSKGSDIYEIWSRDTAK